MTGVAELDRDWLHRHPLPSPDADSDKNSRGRVLVVGGSTFVPGALRLTGEAALRAGAGKLQLATVAPVAFSLGVLVPEAAMIALPANDEGEIDFEAASLLKGKIANCDSLILGPGMSESEDTRSLVQCLIADPRDDLSLVLDAAAITVGSELSEAVAKHEGRVVMTPHFGELAALTGAAVSDIARNSCKYATETAARFNSIVVLKSAVTVIAKPDGAALTLSGDCVGLATSGSGDVLSGVIGGLLARGAPTFEAAAWGVWLHNAAGKSLMDEFGAGFLARDLVGRVPSELHALGGV